MLYLNLKWNFRIMENKYKAKFIILIYASGKYIFA